MARLSDERALLNSMGFPNPGAAVVTKRLRRPGRQTIVGVNIGKTKAVAVEDIGADYASCAALVAGCAVYLVLNVSSPNTPGLRDVQAAVRSGLTPDATRVPLLIKIAPDLSDGEIDAIADLALELGVDGIVAVNTTVDAAVLRGGAHDAGSGGISGAPLKARAIEVLARLRSRVGERLVQVYTAFVYGGPLWPWRMNRGLSKLVREGGWASVQEAIGAGVPPTGRWADDEPSSH